VTLNGEPFDDRTGAIDDFYARLRAGAVATTSQPSPTDFAHAYQRAASSGAESVISIHLDSRTSGTIASAASAARDAQIPVVVVDTRTVSFGVAVCVRAASEVAVADGSAEEAGDEASRLGPKIENVFVARAAPRGRVPTGTGWALLRFADGATSMIATCGSVSEAVEEMARYVLHSGTRVSAAVGHAGREMEAAADALAHRILGKKSVPAVERYRVGASVGAHTGTECLGVFWWPPAR
jgi:fatty acid-binding protein DegV